MIDFFELFTVSGNRVIKENKVPIFEQFSHRPKYSDVVPDELIRRICASPNAKEAFDPVLTKWDDVNKDPAAFTTFLKSIGVETKIIGALKAWDKRTEQEANMSFLEFLLQPQYHHHFSALIGKERMLALNMEIDLRGYLHEVGVLCHLKKEHRIGSQHQGSDVDLMCCVDQMGQQLDPDYLA
jgi:hypothetical protein